MFACAGCGGIGLLGTNPFLPGWIVFVGLWVAVDSSLRPNGKLSLIDVAIALMILVFLCLMSPWPVIIVCAGWWSLYFIRTWRRVGKNEWLPWEKKVAWLDHLTCLVMVGALYFYHGVGDHTLWWLKSL